MHYSKRPRAVTPCNQGAMAQGSLAQGSLAQGSLAQGSLGSSRLLHRMRNETGPVFRKLCGVVAPALQGEDLYAWAKAAAPHMVQTTLADYVRLKRYAYQPGLVNYRELSAMVRAVPLGDGFVDLHAFSRGLKEGGFDGHVAYEMCSPLRGGGSTENLDATATKSIDVINGLIG